MCCFSRPVRHVSQTHIFARPLPGGRQALVYSMNVEIDEDAAMILPLPTASPREEAVEFVDLSGYAGFFTDLRACFPEVFLAQAKSRSMLAALAPARPKLKVHNVGAFEASFVPSLGDFDRLDERFKIPREIWAKIPRYQDHGFAVFKLRARQGWRRLLGRRQTIHPMALTFASRDPGDIFFPTVHIHDGEVHPQAHFDHALYVQLPRDLGQLLDGRWERSLGPLGSRLDEARSGALVDGQSEAFRCTIFGSQENTDTLLSGPRLRAITAIDGPLLLRVRDRPRSSQLVVSPGQADQADQDPAWLAHRDRFREALLPGLRALLQEKQAEWGLLPHDRALPVRWMQFDGRLPLLPPEVIAAASHEPCSLWVPFLDPSGKEGPKGGAHPYVAEMILSFSALPPEPARQELMQRLEAICDEATRRAGG